MFRRASSSQFIFDTHTLTEKRTRLLEQIGRYRRAGEFPLVREIAADLGLAGESSLRSLLNPLVRCYLFKHGGGRGRLDGTKAAPPW